MVGDNYCPILLCILDGWGYSPLSKGNAVALAETPHWDRFLEGISNQTSNRTSAENSLLTTKAIEKILEGRD